jgi:hypothetical protein
MEDRTIYHYCNTECFFNIVKSKNIWLSNAFKTNDFMELKWILEIIQLPNIGTNLESFKKEYEDWVRTFMRPHIACFSTIGDLLSQWRGYADDGKGVAIGFSQNYFESISKLENKETFINDVVYDQYTQEQLLIKFLKEIGIEEFHFNNSHFEGVSSMVLASEIIKYGLIYKHHSFKEENEVRIIHGFHQLIADSESINYRTTDNNIISYIELPLDINNQCPIKEVIIGPKNMADERDVKDFVQGVFGINNDINVKRSVSSYR